jgi:hypothetical protein
LARDRRPCSVGRAAQLVDVVPDVLADGGVELGDDAGINLQAFRIVEHGGGADRAINMIDKPELLEVSSKN